jgi:hypothetical protein
MEAIRSDAMGGFNTFLEEQKKHPGEAHFTLVLFSDVYDLVHDCVDIRTVPLLDEGTYVPGGATALLDAIGRTVDEVGRRLHDTTEQDRPRKVIVAILTDGLENSSTDYSQKQIAERIRHQQEKYRWEFLFLAANQDAIASAAQMSIQAEDAVSFKATPSGVRGTYRKLSSEVSRRRAKRT